MRMTPEFSLAASAAHPKAPQPVQAAPVAAPGQKAAGAPRHCSFRELLSELNPLQYIPVIGTLFRAITGDVIPEPVRDAGSLVVSTLIGGPVGAALDLGELAVEKLTGINPEKIGDELLADIGIGDKTTPSAPAEQVAKTAPAAAKGGAPTAWSPAQLAAYGVTMNASGELEKGRVAGSDVLNSLEFDQIRTRQVIAQYNTVKSA
jgi:hypothetical protein